MTNATKAVIIAFANSTLGLLVAFNVPLTSAQQGAILAFVNAAAGVGVLLTYKRSHRRIPDFPVDDDSDLREPVA